MVNEKGLFAEFEKDLQTIKSTRLEVIPVKDFYLGILQRMAMVFLPFFLILMFETIITVYFDMRSNRYEHFTYFSGFFASFCIAGVWSLLSYTSIKNYTIFRFHYYDKLSIAPYIDRKIKQLAKVILILFAVITLFLTTQASPGNIAGAGILASIISFITAFILINAEVSRVGMNPLSQIIAGYFEKQKENSI